MSLHTNLQGRLRNTQLPKSHGLKPVFEAVVNAIHALEEQGNLSTTGKIILNINRETQGILDINDSCVNEVISFSIEDNGVGFNDRNLQSFQTLDSDHKIDKGCKGVGRLLWLKVFDKVKISSTFIADHGNLIHRNIAFDASNGVQVVDEKAGIEYSKTIVLLNELNENYRAGIPKKADPIARALLEHCLWYFVREEGVPSIFVYDGDKKINLNKLYEEYMHESAYSEAVSIKNHDFSLIHIKFRASSSKTHGLSLCAANRLVKEENISGKIPGLYGKMSDEKGSFIYNCYVASAYLDEHVRAERTSFDISEEEVDDLFSHTDISLQDIRKCVFNKSEAYLKCYLERNLAVGRARVDEFVSQKAPRYRPILHRINEAELAIDPAISDKELELSLHRKLVEFESIMLEKGHDIVNNMHGDIETYEEEVSDYLRMAGDIKKSDLANYVSHRKVILDLLEQSIQRTETGSYVKEDFIHKLIMPMRKDSNESPLDSCNLWLLDERLAFHSYLASDKTLSSMPITGDSSTKKPDLCALNVCDNPILVSENQKLPLASITIIEIKRPMRNDAKAGEDKDPVEQALGYLDRIRSGKVKTANGRPIPNPQHIPGYCYIICDLTSSIKKRCRLLDLEITSDSLGYFGFNKYFKSYIEVISYDKLVNNAKERNRAFFDKLGFPAA